MRSVAWTVRSKYSDKVPKTMKSICLFNAHSCIFKFCIMAIHLCSRIKVNVNGHNVINVNVVFRHWRRSTQHTQAAVYSLVNTMSRYIYFRPHYIAILRLSGRKMTIQKASSHNHKIPIERQLELAVPCRCSATYEHLCQLHFHIFKQFEIRFIFLQFCFALVRSFQIHTEILFIIIELVCLFQKFSPSYIQIAHH